MNPDATDKISRRHDQLFAWIDLETTGLDPEDCSIIEGAFIITKGPEDGFEELDALTCFFELPSACFWGFGALKMHSDTGLIDAYEQADQKLDTRVQRLDVVLGNQAHDIIHHAFEICDRLILAGRNPQFDRAFLKKHMPHVEDLLHYRHFDVTALTTIDDGLFDAVDEDALPGESHRAEFDIRRDLEIARLFVRGGWKQ